MHTPVPQEVYHSLCSLSPSSTWWKDYLYLAISHLYEVKEVHMTAQDTNLTSKPLTYSIKKKLGKEVQQGTN